MTKVVINRCFGGFGLSEAAYEKLIEWGFPVQEYIEQERDPETGLYLPQTANEGEVIFDRTLGERSELNDAMLRLGGRYWETWIDKAYSNPKCRERDILVRLVEELGEAVNGDHAQLEIIEIPDDVEYVIEDYDGNEHIAEAHRTWPI